MPNPDKHKQKAREWLQEWFSDVEIYADNEIVMSLAALLRRTEIEGRIAEVGQSISASFVGQDGTWTNRHVERIKQLREQLATLNATEGEK